MGRCVQLINLARLMQVPATRTEYLTQRVGEIIREQLFHSLADRRLAGDGKDFFQRRVQAGDAAFEVDGH